MPGIPWLILPTYDEAENVDAIVRAAHLVLSAAAPEGFCILARLLDEVRSDRADLALGSRYAPGGGVRDWSLLRRVISRGGSIYAAGVLRLPVRDLTGGFKCFRREVLEAIDLATVQSRGYAFQVELTYRASRRGFRVVEVPITFTDRVLGRSKMSWRIASEAMLLVPRLRHYT